MFLNSISFYYLILGLAAPIIEQCHIHTPIFEYFTHNFGLFQLAIKFRAIHRLNFDFLFLEKFRLSLHAAQNKSPLLLFLEKIGGY